jgi:TolB-like protein/DNA-binding winged helix-turn-helix (wHTH) protein/Flp pilus assembly protein TadD
VIPLSRLSFDLLLVLARHAPNLITAEELESEVWAGLVVSPTTIRKRVALLREAIGDDAEHPKYISVVRGQGYRLVPPVDRVETETEDRVDKNGVTAGIRKSGRPGLITLAIVAVFVSLAVFLAFQLETDTDAGSASTGAQGIDEAFSEHSLSSRNIPDLSIAVLPFVILGESTGDSYIADGIAEEIINLLAAVETLQVVARTSSFTFRDSADTVDVIARKLRTKHILEGSIQRYGERIRVTAQLIDAGAGYHLWSQRYDRPFTEIIELQDDIALNITTALKVKLKELERPDSAAALTRNAEAYALYLQGRKLFHDRLELGVAGLGRAVASFTAATRIDPGFARAWSGLSASLWLQPAYDDSQDLAGYRPRANQAALTALRIEPDLPEALSVVASLHWIRGDFEQARAHFEHALQRPVADSNVRLWAGLFLDSVGYADQAYALYEEAYQLDSLNQNLVGILASSLTARGDPEKAVGLLHAQIDHEWRDFNQGITLLANGDFEEARQLLADFRMPFGILPARYVDLAITAVAAPESRPVAENAIFEALKTGEMEQRVAFELFRIMGSPAMFEMNTGLPIGIFANRVFAVALSSRGSSIRQDKRFHNWARENGLVEFWNAHGWPDPCQPVSDSTFECS